MQLDDMILVSIDDHVVEPPDMFDRHVPARWSGERPGWCATTGIEHWLFQGQRAGNMGLNAVVTWPKEEWGMDPTGFAEMRPGAYDIHERMRDMNRNGVLASMCFPTFAGFSAGTFSHCRRQGPRAGDGVGVQRLAHRRVVRRVPGPLHPAGHRPHVGPAADGRRDPTGLGQGRLGGHDAGAAARRGPSELPRPRLLGAGLPALSDTRS